MGLAGTGARLDRTPCDFEGLSGKTTATFESAVRELI